MKKERILIPRPRSSFLLVQCPNCGNEQIVFSCTTTDSACKVCGTKLAEKSGGRARLSGVVLRRLD